MDILTINAFIKDMPNKGKISDGYHTFDELYEHRVQLFISLCRCHDRLRPYDGGLNVPVWKSLRYCNDDLIDGGEWFLLGLNSLPGIQITYHLPIALYDVAPGIEMDKAPDFDGHTSNDSLSRLADYF